MESNSKYNSGLFPKRRLKIMHILPLDQKGGMENGVVNIVNKSEQNLFDFSICFLSASQGNIKQFLRPEVELFEIPKKGQKFDFSLCFRLAKLFREKKIDLVHTHNWGTYFHGVIGGKIVRVPVIIHGEHGFNFYELKPEGWIRKTLKRFLGTQVTCIVTMSKDLEGYLISHLGINKNKVVTIYNGVDILKFKSCKKREIYKEQFGFKGKRVIGAVGRLDKIKNFPLLIDAIAILQKTVSNIGCLIVGDGPERVKLEKKIRDLGLEQHVRLTGFMKNTVSAFNAMDVFVLPSFMEGLSNTILESMACEVPVVASNVGGNKELVQHKKTGLLFPSGDSGSLADNIRLVLDNKELRRILKTNARKKVLQNHSLEAMIHAYRDLYVSC